MSVNYLNKMLEDGYTLLTKRKVEWPDDMTLEQQIELIEQLINHFSAKEDYQKCNKLQKKLMKLQK